MKHEGHYYFFKYNYVIFFLRQSMQQIVLYKRVLTYLCLESINLGDISIKFIIKYFYKIKVEVSPKPDLSICLVGKSKSGADARRGNFNAVEGVAPAMRKVGARAAS